VVHVAHSGTRMGPGLPPVPQQQLPVPPNSSWHQHHQQQHQHEQHQQQQVAGTNNPSAVAAAAGVGPPPRQLIPQCPHQMCPGVFTYCGAQLYWVEHGSKQGFWGCSLYPKCEYK
jgi:hypothetical protein